MPHEIERKFLVQNDNWRSLVSTSRRLRQGYLATNDHVSVRVRVDGGEKAKITVKSAVPGSTRQEYEYTIPADDATAMLSLCEGSIIDKVRHHVPLGDLLWEVDVFEGENAGLIVAEVELTDAEQDVPLPDWVGTEVTDDHRYYNARLVKHPFSAW